MVRDTKTALAMQGAMFRAWAFRITSLLWRGRRPSRDKLKVGGSDDPFLVAPGSFTVSEHRCTPRIYVFGQDGAQDSSAVQWAILALALPNFQSHFCARMSPIPAPQHLSPCQVQSDQHRTILEHVLWAAGLRTAPSHRQTVTGETARNLSEKPCGSRRVGSTIPLSIWSLSPRMPSPT